MSIETGCPYCGERFIVPEDSDLEIERLHKRLREAEEMARFYANGWNCFSMMHNDLVKDEGDRARNWLAGRGE